MFLLNQNPSYRQPLDVRDQATLGPEGARRVKAQLEARGDQAETPLVSLPAMARETGVASIHVKDEGHRLGLGSFKALGGAYAVICLVIEEAERRLGRPVDMSEWRSDEVKAVAQTMTMACATDGNHGRSVAQGASLVGAKSAIFVHSGVSAERVAAIRRYGAEMIRVDGNYDDSVKQAAEVAEEKGWVIVSDTSWPGYERIPGLVMQGYTALVREALKEIPAPPTHVFIQAGVGGIAAAVAGYLAITHGADRPVFTVVEPARAACLLETARAGHPVTIAHSEPTVMAMLECYQPSLVAWRILSRVADAFMTVEEEDAVSTMRRLANPVGGDPAIVAGESGCVGLAAFLKSISDPTIKSALGLDAGSRILVVNTEGATDPAKYLELVGRPAADVAGRKIVA